MLLPEPSSAPFICSPTCPGTEGLFCPSCSRTLVTASENRKPGQCVTESGGPAACCSKASSRGTRGGKENLLYFLGQQTGRKADSCSKADTCLPVSAQELLKWGLCNYGGGAACRNRAGSSQARLQTGHRWSDQHLWLSTISLQFGGSVCSRFLEVTFQNCGSLCCGQELPR